MCARVASMALLLLAVTQCVGQSVPAMSGQPTPTSPGQATPFPGLPPRDRSGPATGTSSIRGRVLAADTGAPLRRVVVRAFAPELRESRVATTDAEGRYELRDLPAGRYNVMASKAGFVMLQLGQRRPFEAGRPLQIGANERVDTANFALPRAGVVQGRITDEFGEPVADATVQVMRHQFVRGQRRLMPAGRGAQTNDLGQFRLHGLAPGDYFVSAALRDFTFGVSDDAVGYAPTYYPGTTSVAEASRISVAVGQEVGADFQLSPARLSRISGTVVDSTGKAATRGRVLLVARLGEGLGFMTGGGVGEIHPDGSFSITGVAPGSYQLNVGESMMSDDGSERASVPVVVAGADVTGLALVTQPGSTIAGRIVLEGATAPASQFDVFLMSRDEMFVPTARPKVNEDLTFEGKNVLGRFVVGVSSRAPAWSLKQVLLGSRDITDQGFEANGKPVADLQVVVTTRNPEMRGTVTNEKGEPVSDYTVVAFAEEPERWANPLQRYVRTARPDQQGQYRVMLPPGRYLFVALDYLEQGGTDPDLLARLRPRATAVSLAEGDQRALTLKVVSDY